MSADPLETLSCYPGPTRVGRLTAGQVSRAENLSSHLPRALFTVIGLWFVYLLVTPWLWSEVGIVALAVVPTVGVFLFSWLGYYIHELWHQYFPGINNRLWFNVTCWMLFVSPPVYRLAHSSHHKFVHTTDDMEFFCEDWDSDRKKRRRQFYSELIFGSAAWQADTLLRLVRGGRLGVWPALLSFCPAVIIAVAWLGALWFISPALCAYGVVSWMATAWLGSVLTRHNQWMEHLGIIDGGDIVQRNALTRNLAPTAIWGRIFNLYVHDDAAEHIYHHTDGRLPTRNVGFGLPADANKITLADYFRILRTYARGL